MEIEEMIKTIIFIVVLVILVAAAILLLKGKGSELLTAVKGFLRFGR